jgi:hypothetical protein
MLHRIPCPLVVVCLLLSTPVFAARTVSQDQPLHVRLELQQMTTVVFPEPIASVAVAIEKEQGSIHSDGPYLFLLLLDPTVQSRCFVMGASGKLYLLQIKAATPPDDIVYLTAPPAPGSGSSGHATPLTTALLLRAWRTGTSLPGQAATEVSAPTLGDPRLALLTTQAVSWGTTIGLVATVQNTSPQPLTLDLRWGIQGPLPDQTTSVSTWIFAPRLTVKAVAADEDVLSPGGQARVYLVLERRP